MARTIATTKAMPYSVLSTVFDHYTPTIRGKTATSVYPLLMYPAPPCVYKRRRRTSLKGSVNSLDTHGSEHTHPLPASDIDIRHAQTPLLAETWELSSLSRPACTPYDKHSRCKIIQCTRTPPLLDVRPRGRNQDKPVRYCVASCIIIWDEETRGIY